MPTRREGKSLKENPAGPSDQNRRPLMDSTVKGLRVPVAGNRVYRDGSVGGFGCRVTAAGFRSFILEYRVRGSGRKRTYTIGAFPNWTTGAARTKARELKRLVDAGADPQGQLDDARAASTMPELIERFRAEHLPRRRVGTQVDYESIIERHIRPHFAVAKLNGVTHADVEALHRRITAAGNPYRANRVVALLSRMFSLALRWGMRTDGVNPAKGIEKNVEHHRRRYLKADELAALLKALAAYSDQRIADAVRLLQLTGARRGEVLAMRWADLDLTAGTWAKPPSSTKQNKPHEVPLNAPARQILAKIREEQIGKHRRTPEFVFPGAGLKGHVVEIKRAWRSICRAAAISDLRIHDLRHSYASEIASAGGSLPLIGALLGHSNPATTGRYSHLYLDPLRAATERVGATFAAAAGAETPPKEPTPLKGRGRPP